MSGDDRPTPTESAQLDLATAFMAILLLYLVVVLLMASAQGEGETQSAYRLRDPEAPETALRLYRDVYPFRTYWIVEGERFAELDLARIARDVAASGGGTPVEIAYEDGTLVAVDVAGPFGPTGFGIAIERPQGLILRDDVDGPWMRVVGGEALAREPATGRAFYFVERIGLKESYGHLAALRRNDPRASVHIASAPSGGRWRALIERQPDGFGLETMFR